VPRRLLLLTCAVLLVEGFAGYVLTPLVETYRTAIDLSDAATGVMVAAYAAGAVLRAVPAGWFVSRFNQRTALLVGLLGGFGSLLWESGRRRS
jgi:predicted MFS family arabinose efflux permease